MFGLRRMKHIEPVHRTCGACGGQIFHAVDEKGNIVPLDSEPELRYLVPEEQLVYGPNKRPNAMTVRTYTGHIQTCPRRKQIKRVESIRARLGDLFELLEQERAKTDE